MELELQSVVGRHCRIVGLWMCVFICSAQTLSSGASLTIPERQVPVYVSLPSPQFQPSPISAQPLALPLARPPTELQVQIPNLNPDLNACHGANQGTRR
jgi:hypothetical protein